MLHHMHVSIGRWLSGSERSQQIYCQSYFRRVVLGFKINLQKLKGASLLYLLVLLSWVVSPHFRYFCCLNNFSSTSHQLFFFFWKRYSHRFRSGSGFQTLVDSGFQINVDSGFQSTGFRIPTSKICWIAVSGFCYMRRCMAWKLSLTPLKPS